MGDPTIDVVIPVYNGARTVESAVASIQAQSVRDIRIVLVNDGSTDATGQTLGRLAGEDRRLLLINRPNGGIVDTLNAGLAACTAEFVARHDADDLATPDRFARQLAYLRENSACAAVSGGVIHMDEAGRPLGPVLRLPSPDAADPHSFPQREPYLMHPFLMVRRAAIAASGGYRHVFHAEDTDLYWRLQERGRLVNLPDLLGYYRIHAASVSSMSILNGRISAVNSQRAGISALRRRAGQPDIAFAKAMLAEYQAAGSLREIIRVGSRDLTPPEALRLQAASCAKLLDLASYRPYELEAEDCVFVRDTLLAALPGMPAANRRLCARMLAGTAARMATQGRLATGLQLVPRRLYPMMAGRVAFRLGVPTPLRRAVRRLVGRAAFLK